MQCSTVSSFWLFDFLRWFNPLLCEELQANSKRGFRGGKANLILAARRHHGYKQARWHILVILSTNEILKGDFLGGVNVFFSLEAVWVWQYNRLSSYRHFETIRVLSHHGVVHVETDITCTCHIPWQIRIEGGKLNNTPSSDRRVAAVYSCRTKLIQKDCHTFVGLFGLHEFSCNIGGSAKEREREKGIRAGEQFYYKSFYSYLQTWELLLSIIVM
jgi:hypothetical protein